MLFSSVICTANGHSDADCFAHAGSVNKSVEDEISAESSSYMKYFETGEYVLQMFVLSAISPLSDRLGRKKLLIGGLVGISIDAMGTALLAHRPELVVALHLVCSAFSGKCALLPFPATNPVANQLRRGCRRRRYLVFAQVHAVAADRTDSQSRSPVFMVLDASVHLGILSGPLTAGGLADLLRRCALPARDRSSCHYRSI